MAREKAVPHNASSLRMIAEALRRIATRIAQVADKYDENKIVTPILIHNQTAVDNALLALDAFQTKAEIGVKERTSQQEMSAVVQNIRDAGASPSSPTPADH